MSENERREERHRFISALYHELRWIDWNFTASAEAPIGTVPFSVHWEILDNLDRDIVRTEWLAFIESLEDGDLTTIQDRIEDLRALLEVWSLPEDEYHGGVADNEEWERRLVRLHTERYIRERAQAQDEQAVSTPTESKSSLEHRLSRRNPWRNLAITAMATLVLACGVGGLVFVELQQENHELRVQLQGIDPVATPKTRTVASPHPEQMVSAHDGDRESHVVEEATETEPTRVASEKQPESEQLAKSKRRDMRATQTTPQEDEAEHVPTLATATDIVEFMDADVGSVRIIVDRGSWQPPPNIRHRVVSPGESVEIAITEGNRRGTLTIWLEQ